MIKHPRISIVTPSYNQGHYLEQTIQSVLDQQYPNLEYFVIDGGSDDQSIDVIKKYSKQLTGWVSEPDGGMYHALQKGFEKCTGKIMGWINSDDLLHPRSLFNIAEILSLTGVHWFHGIPNVFDEQGRTVRVKDLGKWSQLRHYTDDLCIQQDCTFWSRDLWERAGGYIDNTYKLAGDFELWNRFFQHERLFSSSCITGGFRLSKSGQLSMNHVGYFNEVARIRSTIPDEIREKIKKLNRLNAIKKRLGRSRILNIHFLISRLDKRIGDLFDFPPYIDFNRATQEFEIIEG